MKKCIYILAIYALICSAFPFSAVGSNRVCLHFYNSRVLNSKFYSPSGLLPVFKLPHLDSAEIGTDGLYYINPSTMLWGKVKNGEIEILQEPPTEKSVEGVLNLKIKKTDSILKTVLEGEELDISDRISLNGEEISNALGLTTRLRIRASSSNPNQIHTLVLKSETGQVEVSFKAPTKPADIVVDLPQRYRKPSETVKIAFKWQSNKSFHLKLFGPIVFERDISVLGLARTFALELVPEKSNRSGTSLSPKVVANKAIENLFNPKKIENTLAIVQKGRTAVFRKLLEYGIEKEVPFAEKIEAGSFFFLSDLNFFGDRVFNVPPKTSFRYPTEVGEFAIDHGRWTHGLQLITMLDGMTKDEIKTFLYDIYAPIFSQNTNLWGFWDLMFDSPGDSIPSSPFWWRKTLEERGLFL